MLVHLGSWQTCPQFLRQLMYGSGNPPAWHSIVNVSPSLTLIFRIGNVIALGFSKFRGTHRTVEKELELETQSWQLTTSDLIALVLAVKLVIANKALLDALATTFAFKLIRLASFTWSRGSLKRTHGQAVVNEGQWSKKRILRHDSSSDPSSQSFSPSQNQNFSLQTPLRQALSLGWQPLIK